MKKSFFDEQMEDPEFKKLLEIEYEKLEKSEEKIKNRSKKNNKSRRMK